MRRMDAYWATAGGWSSQHLQPTSERQRIIDIVNGGAIPPAPSSAAWHSICTGESLRPGALNSTNNGRPAETISRSGAPARTPSDLKIAPSIAVLAPPFGMRHHQQFGGARQRKCSMNE